LNINFLKGKKNQVLVIFFFVSLSAFLFLKTDLIVPNSLKAILEKAYEMEEEANYEKALEYYYQALDINDDNFIVKKKIVLSYLSLGDIESGRRVMNDFIESDNQNIDLYKLQLDLYNNTDKQKEIYKTILNLYLNKGAKFKAQKISKTLIFDYACDDKQVIELYIDSIGVQNLKYQIHLMRQALNHSSILEGIYNEYYPNAMDYILDYDFDILNFYFGADIDRIDFKAYAPHSRYGDVEWSDESNSGHYSFRLSHRQYKSLNDYVIRCYSGNKLVKTLFINNFLMTSYDKNEFYYNAEHLSIKDIDFNNIVHKLDPDKLTSLHIENNNIDFSLLKKFTKLERLSIKSDDHINLEAISQLKNLRYLSINTKEFDTTISGDLINLEYLKVKAEKFDVSSLDNLQNLKHFILKADTVYGLSNNNLSNLKQITVTAPSLNLSTFNTSDFLESVYLNVDVIEGTWNEKLKIIDRISLYTNEVDWSMFDNVKEIKYLSVSSDYVKNSLSDQLTVHSIKLSVSKILDLSSISKVKKSTALDIYSKEILGEVGTFDNLEYISVRTAGNINVSNFSNNDNLRILKVRSESISGNLNNLINLESLTLNALNEFPISTFTNIKSDNLLELEVYPVNGDLEELPNSKQLEKLRISNSPNLTGKLNSLNKFKSLEKLKLYGSTNNLSGKTTLADGEIIEFNDNNSIVLGKKYFNNTYMNQYPENKAIPNLVFYSDGTFEVTETHTIAIITDKGRYYETGKMIYCELGIENNGYRESRHEFVIEVVDKNNLILRNEMISSGKGYTNRDDEFVLGSDN